MQLQQLRYLIAVAEHGSINRAARDLFVSQSSVSSAIKSLESEFGITIFTRTNRGITLTTKGVEFMNYARQVIDQADLMTRHFGKGPASAHLTICTQHHPLAAEAVADLIRDGDDPAYGIALLERDTSGIIDEVSSFRADLGLLYLDEYNRQVLTRRFHDADLRFVPLFNTKARVVVGASHPLAKMVSINPEQLASYPRLIFGRGAESSNFYAEEPMGWLPHERNVLVNDRASMVELLAMTSSYTISGGSLARKVGPGVLAAIPLARGESMSVGYIVPSKARQDALLGRFVRSLCERILESDDVTDISPTVRAYGEDRLSGDFEAD